MEQLINSAKDCKSYALSNLFLEFIDSHFDEIKYLNDYEKRKTLTELIKVFEIDDLNSLRLIFNIEDNFQILTSAKMIDKIVISIEQSRRASNE